MNFQIDSLNKEDAFSYMKTKLLGAKCTRDIFEQNALEAIANAANGIPRLINKICCSCMMIAYTKKMESITADIVLAAVNDMELQ